MSFIDRRIVLLDLDSLDEARFWLAGSIAGRGLSVTAPLLPIVAAAMTASVRWGARSTHLAWGPTSPPVWPAHNDGAMSAGACAVALAGAAVAMPARSPSWDWPHPMWRAVSSAPTTGG